MSNRSSFCRGTIETADASTFEFILVDENDIVTNLMEVLAERNSLDNEGGLRISTREKAFLYYIFIAICIFIVIGVATFVYYLNHVLISFVIVTTAAWQSFDDEYNFCR